MICISRESCNFLLGILVEQLRRSHTYEHGARRNSEEWQRRILPLNLRIVRAGGVDRIRIRRTTDACCWGKRTKLFYLCFSKVQQPTGKTPEEQALPPHLKYRIFTMRIRTRDLNHSSSFPWWALIVWTHFGRDTYYPPRPSFLPTIRPG
jgi:hypothetical protein